MSVRGGGERIAVHSISAALNSGHEVTLVSENFDAEAFEDFFSCKGLFGQVELLTYHPFSPLIAKLMLYQRLLYHNRQISKVLPRNREFELVLSTQDIEYVPRLAPPVIHYCYFPEYFSHLESNPSSLPWQL